MDKALGITINNIGKHPQNILQTQTHKLRSIPSKLFYFIFTIFTYDLIMIHNIDVVDVVLDKHLLLF